MAAGSACCRLIIVGGDVVGSFTPKGSAFLWVSKAQQPRAQGVVISHEYKAEDFQQRFAMQGTLDDTAFITVPTALQVPLPKPPTAPPPACIRAALTVGGVHSSWR